MLVIACISEVQLHNHVCVCMFVICCLATKSLKSNNTKENGGGVIEGVYPLVTINKFSSRSTELSDSS